MSRVEDARKLMQDFVAPELRAITVRMDAAEQLATEQLATERHSALPALFEKIESVRREVSLQVELAMAMANRRIEELQARQLAAVNPQPSIGQ
jgi:hypothetical protein